MAFVGISIGSNQGDRLQNLREATVQLANLAGSDHLLLSGIYETDPVDCPPGSPLFLNAVVEIETELAPLDLLAQTQLIEARLGRPAEREKNAPRPLDLDLLYFDDLVLEEPNLILPHPRMIERAFVLLPLSEIRPEYLEKAERADQPGIRRIEETLR